ncbi:hypothetical protein [Fictibacillus gelatini]|uniref:hypothetical protein n=1 Tax=Fictibacillus gelatini TaxID=225985 RepID=UPI00040A48D2|nr:hypothetical protein [Fictibacillus gelatini]
MDRSLLSEQLEVAFEEISSFEDLRVFLKHIQKFYGGTSNENSSRNQIVTG